MFTTFLCIAHRAVLYTRVTFQHRRTDAWTLVAVCSCISGSSCSQGHFSWVLRGKIVLLQLASLEWWMAVDTRWPLPPACPRPCHTLRALCFWHWCRQCVILLFRQTTDQVIQWYDTGELPQRTTVLFVILQQSTRGILLLKRSSTK